MKSSSHDPEMLANTSWNNHSLQPKLSPFAKELGTLGLESSPIFQGRPAKATGFIGGNGSEHLNAGRVSSEESRSLPLAHCWSSITLYWSDIICKRKVSYVFVKSKCVEVSKAVEHWVSARVCFGDWLWSRLLAGRTVELCNYDLQLSQVSFTTFLPSGWPESAWEPE